MNDIAWPPGAPSDPLEREFWRFGFTSEQCQTLAQFYRQTAAAGLNPGVMEIANVVSGGRGNLKEHMKTFPPA